jgi:hypothetical protein
MQRRNALKLLAGAATLPLLSRDALAFFRSLQTQITEKPDLKTFTPAQNAMVETMSELIIPATDTPGAKGARVSEFIDLILSDWSDDADKKIFLDGLADVDQRSQGLFGKNFLESTVAQQTEVMRVLDEELVKAQSHIEPNRDGRRVLAEKTFYYMMKSLTLVGYYTSQVGEQEELHYEIIPSAHEQCAPIPAKEQS